MKKWPTNVTKKPTSVAQPAHTPVNPVVDIDEKEFDLMEEEKEPDLENLTLASPSAQTALPVTRNVVRVSLRIVPCLN